jgi:hypothetical protein
VASYITYCTSNTLLVMTNWGLLHHVTTNILLWTGYRFDEGNFQMNNSKFMCMWEREKERERESSSWLADYLGQCQGES